MAAPAPSMPTGPVLGSKTKPKPAPTPAPAPVGPPPIAPAKLPKIPLGKLQAAEDTAAAADNQEELAKRAIWAAAAVCGLLVVYMIAGRLAAVVTRWPAPIFEPVAASHCIQFIALAKTAYGENWRVRLDPRDTTCDQEVKAEWEHQQLTRYVPPPAQLWAPAPAAPAVARPQTAASAQSEHCLNVVSLAKTKYGADWRTKLEGADTACAGGGAPAAAVTPDPGLTALAPVSAAPDATPTAAPPAADEVASPTPQ